MTWLVGLLLALSVEDPRIHLVELQLQNQDAAALEASEAILRERPEEAQRGLDYLRGHLLDRLGRRRQAVEAYGEAMTATPALAPYSRFRIALDQERLGHPEVAAGVVATVLVANPPRSLIPPATQLLARTLANGGDCRLLRGLNSGRLPTAERRRVELLRADCALRAGEADEAMERLLAILQEDPDDLPAWEAAERMAAQAEARTQSEEIDALLGLTFHRHREFARSERYLERIVIDLQPTVRGPQEFETYYRFVRSHFWQGQFERAAEGFGELARRTNGPQERAQALYQQGRSYELVGDWGAAAESYLLAHQAEPLGEWGAAALVSALRLQWRGGREDSALGLLEILATRREWRHQWSRAALFLASSDIVRGRTDRAASFLTQADRATGANRLETAFWRGRLAELEGKPEASLRHYLNAVRQAAYDPFALAARQRLSAPGLATPTQALAQRLAASGRTADLYSAWILLGDDDPRGREVRQALTRRLRSDRAAAPFLALEPVPVGDWPLWRATLERPEETLLALGIWEEGAPVVMRHFPIAQPALAFTASRHLAAAGLSRPSLLIAEILRRRVPARLPAAFLADGYRRLLHPFPYRDLLVPAAQRHGVDAYLLAAILREESRFDPEAVSSASARGLAQFVFPTANRLARKIGLGAISPQHLENPETSIELAAAYLAELGDRFGDSLAPTVAAYNAGETQAHLWGSYCYSRDSAEYLTKVGFAETRSYLAKVLSSRAQYEELYDLAEPSSLASNGER